MQRARFARQAMTCRVFRAPVQDLMPDLPRISPAGVTPAKAREHASEQGLACADGEIGKGGGGDKTGEGKHRRSAKEHGAGAQCDQCGGALQPGKGVEAMGGSYCSACFVCALCTQPIVGIAPPARELSRA